MRCRGVCVLALLALGAATAFAPAAESVRVALHRGCPALQIDGRPVPPHMLFNTSWDPEVVADDLARSFARAGIHLHQFDVNLDWSEDFGQADLAAIGERYRSVDDRLAALRAIDEAALVLLRVHLNPPVAWGEQHPDEVLTAEDGTRITHGKWSASVSYGSVRWREDAGKRLRALIGHLQRSGLERHILGYLLFAGWSGEWNFFRQERGGLPGARYAQLANMATDHSPAMARAFRAYLRRRYATNDSLRRAWRQADVDLDAANVPTEKHVYAALPQQLNDPRSCVQVADYFACLANEVAGSLLQFAGAAKDQSPDRLCGAFFGEYLFAAIGGNRELLRTGHAEFHRVVASPDIDFLVTPNCYQSRGLGQHSPSMTLVDSAQRHGKLVWYEFDQPTHLAERPDAPADLAETRALMRRAFAYCLCENLGLWWWDQESRCTNAVAGGVWYRDPEIKQEFAQYQRLWRRAMERDRSSVAEIAIVYDPMSCLYQRPVWKDLTRQLIYEQVDALGKLGAPYDIFSLTDVGRARDDELYIIWNALYLTDEQTTTLQRLTHRRGVTTVWWYAPGYLGPAGCSLSRMSDLIGMGLEDASDVGTGLARVAPAERALAPGVEQFGWGSAFRPVFAALGPARPLAFYDSADRPTAVAIAERDGWRSIYVGTAPVPRGLLRSIVASAGIHQYVNSDDVVYANASYIALHAAEGGQRVVRLPRRATVVDAFTGEEIARDSDRLVLTFESPDTRILAVQ